MLTHRSLGGFVSLVLSAALLVAGCQPQVPVPTFPDPTRPPTTTSAPTSTAVPTTSAAPTSTAAPTPTSTVVRPTIVRPPTTTAAPVDPPDVPAVPVGPRVLFDGDFDAGGLGQYSNVQTFDRNGDPAGYCSRAICVRDGGPGHPTAAKVEVRDGDVPNFGGGERAELRAPDAAEVQPGDERWYQFSLRFDQTFPNPTGGWFIVMQWHAGSGSPPLALEVSRSGVLQFANNRSGARTDIGPVRRGQWVDYVLHVRHSTGSGALAEAWVDGVHTGRVHRHPNMASSSSYLKLGIYRDGDDTKTASVWHDDLLITGP